MLNGAMSRLDPQPAKGIFQRRVVDPVLHLLRTGCTPREMAWSLAVGFAVGINPLLGSTTVLSLLLAFALRLNVVASQLITHLVYPLQLALFFVFLRLGDHVFHTGPLPLSREQLFYGVRHHPIAITRELWRWEWHALVVWLLVTLIVTPLAVAVLTPLLQRVLARLHTEHAA